MTQFDKQLSDLKAKSERAGDQAKSEWTNMLANLRRKKQVATESLKQLKRSSADKWQEVKAGAEVGLADLEEALKDAFAGPQSEAKSAPKLAPQGRLKTGARTGVSPR